MKTIPKNTLEQTLFSFRVPKKFGDRMMEKLIGEYAAKLMLAGPTDEVLNTTLGDRRALAYWKQPSQKDLWDFNAEGQRLLPTFGGLFQDLWTLLFRSPESIEVRQPLPPRLHLNAAVLQAAMTLPEFMQLRPITHLDDVNTVMAMGTLKDPVLALLRNIAKVCQAVDQVVKSEQKVQRQVQEDLEQQKQQQKQQQQQQKKKQQGEGEPQPGEGDEEGQDGQPQPGQGGQPGSGGEESNQQADGQGQEQESPGTEGDQPAPPEEGTGEGRDRNLDPEPTEDEGPSQELKAALKELKAAEQNLESEVRASASQIRKQLGDAAKTALDLGRNVQQTQALLNWGRGAGKPWETDPSERLRLAQRIARCKPLLKALELVGHYLNLGETRHREKTTGKGLGYAGVRRGRNVGRQLSHESVRMTDPELEGLWAHGWATRQNQELDPKQIYKLILGPGVIMVDVSGSMTGDPIEFAIAMTVACLRALVRKNRPAYVGAFDDGIRKVWDITDGDPRKIVDFAAFGASGGGTNFYVAIDFGLKKIEEAQRAGKDKIGKSDIVLITDGICPLPETAELKKRLDAAGVNLFVFFIGRDYRGYMKDIQKLTKYAWAIENYRNAEAEVLAVLDSLE